MISLVGYTNAGKSTILNRLSDAGVLAEDKLFATLDTTTRKIELPGGSEVFLTDTVGFIQKLPHHLVQAFRATLEELQYADILLHVVDASDANRAEHIEVVYDTLRSLGCEDTPVITVFNKMDREVELPLPMDTMARDIVQVSAQNGCASGAGGKAAAKLPQIHYGACALHRGQLNRVDSRQMRNYPRGTHRRGCSAGGLCG